ncbi:MAG: DUF1501 domain-containing protein [Gammaproteobacteria bacterium]|nr:DUF1501 domain-containing protein [Gammaproteobacteria bacterium]
MKSRREFLKAASLFPLATGFPLLAAEAAPFAGKFVVTIQALGAWDVTCFCDPKENQRGEPEITKWSISDEIQQAGNITYAPFGNNANFFKKYASKMLVINGVDSLTNSHSIGETVNWSGRTALGFPTLTALYAAAYAPSKSMSYVTFGGFNRTENVIRATQLGGSVDNIRGLLRPNFENGRPIMKGELWSLIKTFHRNESASIIENAAITAGNRRSREAYLASLINMEPLEAFADSLPRHDEWEPRGENGNLRQQAQFAIAAFKAGVSVSADLSQGGFDSHEDNDSEQRANLNELTDGIDYLWDAAEEADIADRLIVIVGSDFSRTPYYNSAQGKDHWSVGSYIIMEKGKAYTNRVVDGSDEGQNALKINPSTLKRDSFGTKLATSHIHEALRDYLGLSGTAMTSVFPFNNTEKFNFFG